MNKLLCRQLSLDYVCSEAEVTDGKNHFTHHRILEGRRRFQEQGNCILKIAAIDGKLLFTGADPVLSWCEEQYRDADAAWFFEAKNLHRLNDRLRDEGSRIEMVHPFFLAEEQTFAKQTQFETRWFEGDEIEAFRGDKRFDEAFAFDRNAPDVLGVAAIRGSSILGMAGASCDSPIMWQIGINVAPEEQGHGIGTNLVTLLKNEILSRGILPFYGTSMSHLASQRVALGAGFVPAWVELITSRIERA